VGNHLFVIFTVLDVSFASLNCGFLHLVTIIAHCVDDAKVKQEVGPVSFCSAIFLLL